MPQRGDAKLLQVLVRQARDNRFVYLIFAEDRLILPEAKAAQPDNNVHDNAPQSGMAAHHRAARGECPGNLRGVHLRPSLKTRYAHRSCLTCFNGESVPLGGAAFWEQVAFSDSTLFYNLCSPFRDYNGWRICISASVFRAN